MREMSYCINVLDLLYGYLFEILVPHNSLQLGYQNQLIISGAILRKEKIPSQMTEKHIQWLTYHFNIEYMFHIALEQLHNIDNNDENYYVRK
jgi:hypothetical protein